MRKTIQGTPWEDNPQAESFFGWVISFFCVPRPGRTARLAATGSQEDVSRFPLGDPSPTLTRGAMFLRLRRWFHERDQTRTGRSTTPAMPNTRR